MKRTVALLTCMALMIPGAAVASANSTSAAYGQPKVKNVTASRGPSGNSHCTTSGSGSGSGSSGSSSSGSSSSSQCVSATETTATGSLPFTGIDVAALAAGGVVLLGAGFVLRRFTVADRA